jgi:tripartite-type tricarboxylate transporter receptor subunit TctC
MRKREIALMALLLPWGFIDPVPAAHAAEAEYPAREIRFVVPFPPGGGNDVVGRLVADRLQSTFGKSVLVDNRGGAGGTTGTAIVANSTPDGYTLLINNISLAINATLVPKLPYDTQKSFQPVSLVGRQPNVLAIALAIKVASVGELLKLARGQADPLVYGSGGPGSSSHLAGARLQMATGIRMTHVPYKGLAPAMTDLDASRIDLIIATMSTALPHVQAGKIRALAVTSAQRTSLLPNLPTMIESGVKDYEVTTWYMVLAPAKTPGTVMARLNQALRTITADTRLAKQFAELGLEPAYSSPAQAATLLKSEIRKWSPVVKAAAAKPG